MDDCNSSDVDFYDGHKVEGIEATTKLAKNMRKASSKFVSIFDGLLDDDWCKRAYEYSASKSMPWGLYIPTSDVFNEQLRIEDIWEADPERAIALVTTRELFFNRGKGMLGDDINMIAGTAVWCLSSQEGNAVEYHMDYAELFRYETNIICPPLYAGTYHMTPFLDGELMGGDFKANLGGLDHYQKFGYKGCLATPSELNEDICSSSDWISVPYKFNRGIIHDGDLPHLSTPITSIRSLSPGNISQKNKFGSSKGGIRKRIILGFNCFPQRLDECCRRAPEHSDAFNRTIKLYQTVSSLSQKEGNQNGPNCSQPGVNTFSVKDVLKNPALARLLVLAARKVKEQKERSS